MEREEPEAPRTPAWIEARNVHASYGGRSSHRLVEEPLVGVNLALGAGELVCLLGPNGAGKSTLVRVLAGTLPPTRGEVRLFGRSMAELDRREVARVLAVVPQISEVAWGFPVRDVVTMGRAPHQDGWLRASDEDRQVVSDVLERCDLTRLANRPVDELSGGEQKRVAIARALAQKPRVLLLDEPAAFLDVHHQIGLYDLLAESVAREQLACLVVMHDLNAAAQYATRVALAKGGRFVAVGTVEEVMTYRTLRETFDADLYCGLNELTGARFFVPMRGGNRPGKGEF
ncbi:MAG TPA: ABC transporter ATP-binding protein [Polyangiaceae bacterium]